MTASGEVQLNSPGRLGAFPVVFCHQLISAHGPPLPLPPPPLSPLTPPLTPLWAAAGQLGRPAPVPAETGAVLLTRPDTGLTL